MATLVRHDSRPSWWWVSHISPKNSKWLQENLSDMDTKVKSMMKLINEDADSFARRAEMYYKKRPELMKLVEEFYRAYRALAERYDQATGALRHAHRTISEAFPNQMPPMSDDSPSAYGQEMEPHTPDMSTFTRASFDSDDQKDGVGTTPQHFTSKRNGTHPEETSALSSRKGLKLFNDLSSSSENVPRGGFDGKVRKGLTFESPEVKGKEDISNEMANLQQEVSRLLAESQNLKQQMLSESERADKAEKEIQILKETVLQLNSDKDTSLLQYNQSSVQISTLESELCKAQADLKKLSNEMAADVQKLINAETLNAAIQSKAEGLDQKMKMQQQELEQKLRELENFRLSFQEEHEKRMQAESALLSQGKELAQSHEEVQRLATEIKMANEKSNELKQTKEDLENTVCELKKDVKSLTEQNHSSEALIQKLRDEINTLKDSKNELESEIQSLKSTISQLETEKNAAILQHQQSVEQVSVLESQLSKLQSELEDTEQKVQLVTQHLEQKEEEVNSVHAQLQDERNRRTQTEATLLMTEGLHSQLQEKTITLTQDLDRSTKKLNELENSKLNLESTLKELKNTILDLNSEKNAALLQQEQSLEKASDLEAGLSKMQLELEKSEQKIQLLELEIAQKNECVDSLELSLKDECEKMLQAQESLVSMKKLYSQSQDDVSKLHVEIEKQNGMLNELENLSSELKNTILLLKTEKDATLHENQQSSVRITNLESELMALKAELEKVEGKLQILEQELRHKKEEADSLRISLQDEAQKRVEGEASLLMMTNLHYESQNEVNKLALEIEKLSGSLSQVENSKTDLENIVSNLESELTALKAELEKVEGKVQILDQELRHKKEEADNLRISLQDEAQKRVEGEASLLMMTNLHSESQNEVNKLALEIEKLFGSLSQVENSKTDLENIVTKHAEEIHILREQNLSTELMISDLHRELDALKESNVKLQTDIGLHIGEKETLQRDLASQMEEKENLEGIHHTLVDEMDALKASAARNQKLIEQLQITNSKLKEVCAKNEVEKALLSEKVQEVEKLSEEHSLLENSLSDANAEMDALREKIKAFEASERSLNDVISCHVSEKAVLASEVEILGKSLSDMSEKNSILDISLSDMKTELEDLRTKLKDSEESCQAHLANNSALSAETVALRERIKALETSESSLKDAISHHVSEKAVLLTELEILGKKLSEVSEKNSILDMSLSDVQTELVELRTNLKDSEESCQVHLTNNSALSAEKDNLFSQLESITMIMKALEGKHANLEDKHSSVSREKDFAYDQVRELQDQLRIKNEECKDAVKSYQLQVDGYKKQISSLQEKILYVEEMLQQEHQKNMCASISTVILENSLADEQDKKVSLFTECQKHAEATQSAKMLVSELMDESRHHEEERKSLLMHNEKLREGISKQMKVLNICQDLGSTDEILLQTVSDETINVLKLKEEAEDVNGLMCIELSVLSAVLLQVGMELRDLHLQKCALEKEVESGAADLLSLQNKNHQMLEQNEQLRQGLRESSEREEVLKTEVFITQEKLSCLRESHWTSQDEISNLIDQNESLSKEYQSLSEKYNSLEDENSTILAECMMLENLCLFFRGHNNEIASALVSLTDEMALLSLARADLDLEVNELSRKSMVLESENNYLKEYFMYMLEILRTRLVLSEFDLNTNRSVYQELAGQLENCTAQLMQKDDELQETEEKVQFLQEKNRELCGVVGSLQVAIEGAKVVKAELEKNIIGLTEQCTTKDDEVLLLKQANVALQSEVEQCDQEFLVLMGDAITYSVNSVVYEEKALDLMKEGKSTENSAIALKGLLLKEIYSRDAHIEELQKKLTGIQEEHAELKAELGRHLALIASLADHVSVLGEGALSLSKPCTEGKEQGNDELESRYLPEGTPELQGLIARIEALQAVVLHAKDHQDQESAESAAKLAAANTEIQDLKARGSSRMEAKEIFSEHEKPKDVEVSKGKQVQIMKDIELDRISYGTGAALYSLGPGANAELDDDMLQLWEAAERDCKNQTAKSSSSEHDIQAVEEVKSEYPSSELVMGRDLGINKLEVSKGAVEPHEVWSKNILERLTSDAQRLLSIQASIDELKQKMEGPSKGKSPRNSEYSSVSAQLLETEGYVLEQINFNNKLTRKAENYPSLSGNMSTEREGYSSRRRISEQAQKGSENVARLELELQKMQYVLLKLEEEHEYRRFKVSDKRTRVLLRDYLYGRKDRGGGQKKKKRVPFCGCVRPKSRTEP